MSVSLLKKVFNSITAGMSSNAETLEEFLQGSMECAVFTDVIDIKQCIVARPCKITFVYNGEADCTTRGCIDIQASGVTIQGIRLAGSIVLSEAVNDSRICDCSIQSGVKIGPGAKDVSIARCSVSSQGKVGITIGHGSSVTLEGCSIASSLVGISVSTEYELRAELEPNHAGSAPTCVLRGCTFSNNETDVVACFRIRSGESPGNTTCRIYPSELLRLEDMSIDDVTIEGSITGRFESPICFRTWPIPALMFSMGGLHVKRRGFKSNNLFCHLYLEDDDSIILREDPFVAHEPGKRKRRENRSNFSRAEIHYSGILEIPPGSDESTVGSAFRKLALQHHPDKKGSEDTFISIKRARDELMKIVVSRN